LRTFQITIADTAQTFYCDRDESVFAAMIRFNRYALNQGCCGGGCGICKMKIHSGDYEKFKRMSRAHISASEEAENTVLLCCIKPRSDLIISKGKGE